TLSEEIEIVFVSGLKVLFTAKIIFLINRFDIKEKYNLKFSDAGFKMSPVKLDFKESDIEKMECYLVFQGKQIVNIKIHENVIKSLVNFNQIKK
ncbi:hypothetical protein, partial [Comamonas thiooxydans]|uniref:hypothetical protein n=1 Tax=Comamonas thiooxydans TaxID=363952 RepID=UPI0015541030